MAQLANPPLCKPSFPLINLLKIQKKKIHSQISPIITNTIFCVFFKIVFIFIEKSDLQSEE